MSWRRHFAVALCTLASAALVATPAAAQNDAQNDAQNHAHEQGEKHPHGEAMAQAHGHDHAADMSAEEKAAMEAWMKAGTPGKEHADLAKVAGRWAMTVKSWPGPGAEPIVSQATAERTMVWDRYLEEEVEGDMMGMPFRGRGFTGYDNTVGKYWSTWMDNMSTGTMVSWGTVDETNHTITFTGEIPDPVTGTTMPVRTVIRHPSPGEEVMEMYMGSGDQEFKSMEITYRRAGD